MDIIWEAKLDEVYEVKVVRSGETTGEFSLTHDGKVIHSESVRLAYGARFGPDVEDVAIWEDKAVEIVDGLK